jgi:hypothetical protein
MCQSRAFSQQLQVLNMIANPPVRANGFTYACSNFGGPVNRSSNRFALPRFQPMDWDGDHFADVVQGWYRQ